MTAQAAPPTLAAAPAPAGFVRRTDERGLLSALELSAVPFPVRRVFVVDGPEGGAWRGGHRVPCDEFLVVLDGWVDIERGSDSGAILRRDTLTGPGASVHLVRGEFFRYRLPGPHARVLVCAAEPYSATEASG